MLALVLGAGAHKGTHFAWDAGAQVHAGNMGAPLESEPLKIANTNGAQVFSPDIVISLL